jgi:hypothetical protein
MLMVVVTWDLKCPDSRVRVSLKLWQQLGMVVRTYNPSMPEAEAGGIRVPGQLRLPSKTLSQKRKKKNQSNSPGDNTPNTLLSVLGTLYVDGLYVPVICVDSHWRPTRCSHRHSDDDFLPAPPCLLWAALVLSVLPQANEDQCASNTSPKNSHPQVLDFSLEKCDFIVRFLSGIINARANKYLLVRADCVISF